MIVNSSVVLMWHLVELVPVIATCLLSYRSQNLAEHDINIVCLPSMETIHAENA